jgi:hypothetical protein
MIMMSGVPGPCEDYLPSKNIMSSLSDNNNDL